MKPRHWLLAVIAGYILLSLRLVGRDLYYDEICTLDRYLVCPLADVVLKYTDLNNHFLFSILCNLYLKTIGVTTVRQVLDHPWILRLPLLVFPVIAIYLTYRLGRQLLSNTKGLLAALLLATTVPVYYYGPAIRGYSMSMALFMGFLWAILESRFVMSCLFAAAFAYVMPSNAVFLLATIPFLAWRGNMRAIWAAIIGLSIAFLLYLPVLPGILADPQMKAHDARWRIVTETIPETAIAFVSYRWLLIPVALWGLATNWRHILRHDTAILAASVTVLSLAAFIASGNYLWARVLFPLLPLWCLVAADMLINRE